MSTKYRFNNPKGMYFVTFAVVAWVDVFMLQMCSDIFCNSVRYCHEQKAPRLYAWCLMSNHIHWIFSVNSTCSYCEILRDLKQYISKAGIGVSYRLQ